MMPVGALSQTGAFGSGLYDCFYDLGVCLQTSFCPPLQQYINFAESRGELCTFVLCLTVTSPVWTRANIRRARGMPLNFVNDCITYCMCCPCATCQDAREIEDIRQSAKVTVIMSPPSSPYGAPYSAPGVFQPDPRLPTEASAENSAYGTSYGYGYSYASPTSFVPPTLPRPCYPQQNPESDNADVPPVQPLLSEDVEQLERNYPP
jgi:Cys-rich protein (TIGR01571 family)